MALPAQAGTAPATVPFVQGWADTGQISADDDWSGVTGIVGYRGDGLAGEPGSDPRGVTADGVGTPVDVTANLTDPRAVGLPPAWRNSSCPTRRWRSRDPPRRALLTC